MLVSKLDSGGLGLSEDPYSFVDDEQQQQQHLSAQQAAAALNGGNPLASVGNGCQPMSVTSGPPLQHTPKKRGRKKKIKTEDVSQLMGHAQHG